MKDVLQTETTNTRAKRNLHEAQSHTTRKQLKSSFDADSDDGGSYVPDADAGDEFGEFCDAAGSVGDLDDEADETTVGGETALETASQHRRVDVAATQRDHNPAAANKIDNDTSSFHGS